MPAIFIALLTPLAVLSGTKTFGEAVAQTVTGVAARMVSNTAGSPKHIVTDGGTTVGAFGV